MPDDDNGFEGRTYLYIRDHPSDNGTEPLPAGVPAWMSPDIVVIKPNGTRGGEAVAKQVNQVEVTVTNAGGISAMDAYVDAFFASPSTGLTPATATLVGGGYLSIPGYSRQPITFLWIPPASYAGHGCLLARVSLIMPPDTYRDGTVFDVIGDRHVAQHNIEVVVMDASTRVLDFPFNIVNPANAARQLRVTVREVHDPQQIEHLCASLGDVFAQFGDTPLANMGISVDRGAPPGDAVVIRLEAGGVREANLHIERNPNSRRGDLHAIEVIQVDERGNLCGGLTVVVLQH